MLEQDREFTPYRANRGGTETTPHGILNVVPSTSSGSRQAAAESSGTGCPSSICISLSLKRLGRWRKPSRLKPATQPLLHADLLPDSSVCLIYIYIYLGKMPGLQS